MAYPQRMATEWTAALVAALPDDGNRYEVLDGELAMTPAPSWDHQRLALALRDALTSFLRAHGIGEAIVAPADVEFSSRRLLEPDVFVVPRTPDPSGRHASVSMTISGRSSPRRHRSMHHASVSTIQYSSTCSPM